MKMISLTKEQSDALFVCLTEKQARFYEDAVRLEQAGRRQAATDAVYCANVLAGILQQI